LLGPGTAKPCSVIGVALFLGCVCAVEACVAIGAAAGLLARAAVEVTGGDVIGLDVGNECLGWLMTRGVGVFRGGTEIVVTSVGLEVAAVRARGGNCGGTESGVAGNVTDVSVEEDL
jgi:hypothetical protein